MSEDEIIKTIKEKTDIIKSLCTDDCINKSTVIEPLEYSIKVLLDLYKQEKEKNKELTEGLKYRVNYCNLLEKELYGNGINYNIELTKIEEKYLKELLEEE